MLTCLNSKSIPICWAFKFSEIRFASRSGSPFSKVEGIDTKYFKMLFSSSSSNSNRWHILYKMQCNAYILLKIFHKLFHLVTDICWEIPNCWCCNKILDCQLFYCSKTYQLEMINKCYFLNLALSYLPKCWNFCSPEISLKISENYDENVDKWYIPYFNLNSLLLYGKIFQKETFYEGWFIIIWLRNISKESFDKSCFSTTLKKNF